MVYINYSKFEGERLTLLLADIVQKDAALRALGKCPPRNARALHTWVWNEKPLAVAAGKSDFIFYPEDMVPLAGPSQKERPFEGFIEAFLDSYPLSWVKVCHYTYRLRTSP